MGIIVELKKDITVIAFGIGFDLENTTFGIFILYWQLTFNFKQLKTK